MKHNSYANGMLQNIEFSNNNSNWSIGVVDPGSYHFTADRKEIVKCITGKIIINNHECLPNGDPIEIKEGSTFSLSAEETSSYLCLYT